MRDKGKWIHTPDDSIYSGELLLPSFGIKVTRSAPRSVIFPAGTEGYDLAPDSGDAFSISYLGPKVDATAVDWYFMGLDQAYIRRVLLRVLDGEEYHEALAHYNARNRLEVKPGVPKGKRPTWGELRKVKEPDPKAQVRITDLRLAKDLRPKDLKRELEPALPDLTRPVTADNVLRWKWETLRKPKGMRTLSEVMEKEEWYAEERLRISAISFAAAALCLSVDLNPENLEDSSHGDLTEVTLSWHKLISALTFELDKSVGVASNLLAGRRGTKGGRPPDPELKFYTALILYRIGRRPYEIAGRIGISAPVPPEWRKSGTADENLRFNDNWKSRLYKAIKKGIEIEQEKFPEVADVFAHRDEKEIQEAALAAYNEWLNRFYWWPQYVMDV